MDIIFGAQQGTTAPRRRGIAPDPNATALSQRPFRPPAVRRRPLPGPRTPAAVAGRQHAGQQIDAALERLTSAELAACGVTQTDESGSLPPPTPPQRQRRQTAGSSASVAVAASCDACTQLTDTELPSFDAEVWLCSVSAEYAEPAAGYNWQVLSHRTMRLAWPCVWLGQCLA